MSVYAGRSTLLLPVRGPRLRDLSVSRFSPAEMAPGLAHTRSRYGRRDREIHENPSTGETVYTIHRNRGAYRLHDIDLSIDAGAVERFSITEGDPLSAKGDIAWRYRLTRGDWDVCTESRTVLTADKNTFHLRAQVDAFEGDRRVFAKNWSFDIPRNGV